MNPPLRSAEDVEVLQDALRDGTIDLVATDHAPHHYDAKDREFADAPFGIIGLETALALVVTELVDSGMIDFKTLVDRMSTRPARLFGLRGRNAGVGIDRRRHRLRFQISLDCGSRHLSLEGA